MSSYNDQLHAEISSLLCHQELELHKLKGQYDAAMLSLYYAQGGYSTAVDTLEIANETYAFQKDVVSQAIMDSDVATNVLQSATNANAFVGTAVSHTAVAAANVQMASNAILRLASDIGAIYTIVQAANFETDIYDLTKEAQTLVRETAYLAERVSQESMEASMSIAEVTTSSLADKATTTDAGVKNILSEVTTSFDAANAALAAANQVVQSANKIEKGAEGNLENIHATYQASETAYALSNKALNLAICVSETKETMPGEHQYTVSFSPFRSAFKESNTETPPYPVDAYYVLLVKDTLKTTFSSENAAVIIDNDTDNRYIKIEATDSVASYSQLISTNELNDVNGNPFQLGENYVVFVYAILSNVYKKAINVFDDYVTAPSFPFSITNQLPPAYAITVDLLPESSTPPNAQQVNFTLLNKLPSRVAYRCVFLPDDVLSTKELLTVDALKSTEKKNEKPGFCFNLMIAEVIPAGSYTLVADIIPSLENDDVASDREADTILRGSLVITNSMTDNFGNRLLNGKKYIPVIISISDDTALINKTISNALSDFKNTPSFTYIG